MRTQRGLTRLALLLTVLALLASAVVPLVVLVRAGLEPGWLRLAAMLRDASLGRVIQTTLLLCSTVTLLSVPSGTALALALRHPNIPQRALWRAAAVLPVLVPDFVAGFSWLRAYAAGGLTSDLFGLSWGGLQEPAGVSVVLATQIVPVVYLIVTAGLSARGEPAAERAARSCGATGWTVLRTITLPMLAPAIVTAALLSFVLTLGAFAIPQVIGAPAGFATISTRIYANLALGSDPETFRDALALAVLLALVTLALVVGAEALLQRATSGESTTTTGTGWPPLSRRAARIAAAAIAAYVAMTLVLPLTALVSASVTRAVGLPSTPQNWSWQHYATVLTPRTAAAFGRSLLLAALAAGVVLVLGTCTAALRRSGRAIGVLVALPFVLPGSTLAVAVLIGYGRWLGDTLWIILVAYVAKFWLLAHRPVAAALGRLPASELRAAQAGGAHWPTALWTVILPRLRVAFLVAWGLCFLTALHEVTMSSLLYGPGSETLAVVVLNSAELGRIGATAALSVLVAMAVVLPAGGLWALTSRSRDG